jgi:hypothetical protein
VMSERNARQGREVNGTFDGTTGGRRRHSASTRGSLGDGNARTWLRMVSSAGQFGNVGASHRNDPTGTVEAWAVYPQDILCRRSYKIVRLHRPLSIDSDMTSDRQNTVGHFSNQTKARTKPLSAT